MCNSMLLKLKYNHSFFSMNENKDWFKPLHSDLLSKLHIIYHQLLRTSWGSSCNLLILEFLEFYMLYLSKVSTWHVMNSDNSVGIQTNIVNGKKQWSWGLTHCLCLHKDKPGLFNDKGLITHWLLSGHKCKRHSLLRNYLNQYAESSIITSTNTSENILMEEDNLKTSL